MRLPAAIVLLVAALFGLALAAPSHAADHGRGRFIFTDWDGPALPVWYQLPNRVAPDTPVVVVMHGVKRDADRYRDEWAGLARKYRMIVIVPEFSQADFPGSRSYNIGFLSEADGTVRPRELWSFAAIEPLFDDVRRRFGTATKRYTLYGHSAGGQFVHRFVMFMPQARIEQAIAANSGWYTMPDLATPFPYGLEGAPISPDGMKAALGKPLTVLLGTADTDTTDPSLRVTTEANLQGPHRYARGKSFFATGRAAAARIGAPFGWRLKRVPGVGHMNGLMAESAAKIIAACQPRKRAVQPREIGLGCPR
jgi:poly(3-hydroxybutyrate) depolymerase